MRTEIGGSVDTSSPCSFLASIAVSTIPASTCRTLECRPGFWASCLPARSVAETWANQSEIVAHLLLGHSDSGRNDRVLPLATERGRRFSRHLWTDDADLVATPNKMQPYALASEVIPPLSAG